MDGRRTQVLYKLNKNQVNARALNQSLAARSRAQIMNFKLVHNRLVYVHWPLHLRTLYFLTVDTRWLYCETFAGIPLLLLQFCTTKPTRRRGSLAIFII